MFRPRLAFDSFLIICEILSLQFCFYAVYAVSTLLVDFVVGIPFSHHQILDPASFSFSKRVGLGCHGGQLVAALIKALLFAKLEGRSRKAPDFMTTTFIIHLLVIFLSFGLQKSTSWWISFLFSWILSIVVATVTSAHIEMRDINLKVALPAVLQEN